jgi:hypothetical protein
MTNDLAQKMHVLDTLLRQVLAWLAGAVEALLLARLLARLLAARLDSPAFALLYALTWPLVAPLSALDQGQPRFGAVLEISTLVLVLIIAAGACLLWIGLAMRRRRSGR